MLVISKKMYVVEKFVDYLAFTSKVHETPFSTKPYQLVKSVNKNYDMCEVHTSGMLHMWHSKNKRVGHHWLLTGDTMRWVRANLMTDAELVGRALERGNISRIDIAITSHTEDYTVHEFKPQDVAIAVVSGMLKSRMKPAKDVTEELQVQTKYIGNRQTRKRLWRAYDKGADNGELANILVRYELETRKDANVVGRMVRDNTDLGAIMKRYIDFPQVEAYQRIINAMPATVKHEDLPMSAEEKDIAASQKKWLWLIDSIAPSIAKSLVADGKRGIPMEENENYHEFIRAIHRNIFRNGH